MFNFLTGYARPRRYRKVLVAPKFLRDGIIDEIDETIAAQERGEHARIALKMNALVDRACIKALYRASQAGVPVDLNIRGICRLRPGVEGVSENIRVVSVVGRFLEHSRVFAFERNGSTRVYIGSADLMPRNLDNRVELVAPVDDPVLRDDLLDTLERCLADDTNAWELGADGTWARRTPGRGAAQRPARADARPRGARGRDLMRARPLRRGLPLVARGLRRDCGSDVASTHDRTAHARRAKARRPSRARRPPRPAPRRGADPDVPPGQHAAARHAPTRSCGCRPRAFRAQVQALADAGYHGGDARPGARRTGSTGSRCPPSRSCVSFDDGYGSQAATRCRSCAAHGWPGVLYLEVKNLSVAGGITQGAGAAR